MHGDSLKLRIPKDELQGDLSKLSTPNGDMQGDSLKLSTTNGDSQGDSPKLSIPKVILRKLSNFIDISDFVTNNRHLWKGLIFFFHSNKTAAEAHREFQKEELGFLVI